VILGSCITVWASPGETTVKVHVIRAVPSYWRPWEAGKPTESSGSGVILSDSKILTNAHVVEHADRIHVQRAGTADKWPARVLIAALGPDMAILELEKHSFADAKSLKIQQRLPRASDVVVVKGYPLGGSDLSVTKGIVSRVEFARYSAAYSGLRVQIDAALNPGNSGGPALTEDGRLMGLVFSRMRVADNIGYLIPGSEVASFLHDCADGQFDGQPRLFDEFQKMENKVLRQSRGLTEEQTGIGVRRAHAQVGWPLQDGDILTHIGDFAIGNDGMTAVDGDLRLSFQAVVPRSVKDGKLPLRIVRNGTPTSLAAPLPEPTNRLIKSVQDEQPEYFFCGPIVFSVVSREFVNTLNFEWWQYLINKSSPIVDRRMAAVAFPGEELVFAAAMFPHPSVDGYRDVSGFVLASIDGVPVKNIRHAAKLIRGSRGPFTTFRFADRAVDDLVLRTKEIDATTEDVLSRNGIRYGSSTRLRTKQK